MKTQLCKKACAMCAAESFFQRYGPYQLRISIAEHDDILVASNFGN